MKLTTLLFLFTLLSHHEAHAFTLTPMSVTFESQGRGSSQTFQIENDGKESVAIDVFLATREIDLDGKETFNRLSDKDKSFLIYPEQVLLKANERRNIRITWKGDADFSVEKAFRLVAEQLPVKTEKPKPTKGAVINMLLKYVAAIYVKPKEARSNLKLKDPVLVDEGKKGKKLSLTFDNPGQAHQILTRISLKLTSPNLKEPLLLSTEKIPSIAGQNVLAGHLRRFIIPWPKDLPAGPVQATFELQE